MISYNDWNNEFILEEFSHSNDLIKPSDISEKLNYQLAVGREKMDIGLANIVSLGAGLGAVYYGGATILKSTIGLLLNPVMTGSIMEIMPSVAIGTAIVLGAGLVISKMENVKENSRKLIDNYKNTKSLNENYIVEDLPAYARMELTKEKLSYLREKYESPTPEFKKELKELIEQEKLKIFLKEEGKYDFTMKGEKFEGDWNKDFNIEYFANLGKNELKPKDIGQRIEKKLNNNIGAKMVSGVAGLTGGLTAAGSVLGLGIMFFDLMAKGYKSSVTLGSFMGMAATGLLAAATVTIAAKIITNEGVNDTIEKYKERHKDFNQKKENLIQEIDIPAFERMNAVIQKTAYIREKYQEPTAAYHDEMRNAIKEESARLVKVENNIKKFLEDRTENNINTPIIKPKLA